MSLFNRKKLRILAGMTAAVVLTLCGCERNYTTGRPDIADTFPIKAKKSAKNPQFAQSDGPYAILHTTAGDIKVVLYPEQAPKAVENFIGLAKEGYYNGSIFHYVVRDNLAQAGLPRGGFADTRAVPEESEEMSGGAEKNDSETPETLKYIENKTGESEGASTEALREERSLWDGPFEDEFSDELHNFPGALSMANSGFGSNKSQFYFVVNEEKPEDEKLVSANMYVNQIRLEATKEGSKRNAQKPMTEKEIKAFEEELNKKLQVVSTKGVPEEQLMKYQKAVDSYMELGGNYWLDYSHTVFGQIVEGYNVARGISEVKVTASRQPQKNIVIESIEIIEGDSEK